MVAIIFSPTVYKENKDLKLANKIILVSLKLAKHLIGPKLLNICQIQVYIIKVEVVTTFEKLVMDKAK